MIRRAFMGLGYGSARRGCLVWLGQTTEPRERFIADRLVLQATDGRSWGFGSLEVPIVPDVLELNGRRMQAPTFPLQLAPGDAVRFGAVWLDDGADQLSCGLFGYWETPDGAEESPRLREHSGGVLA